MTAEAIGPTGATPEQIEAAVRRYLDETGVDPSHHEHLVFAFGLNARHLVPTGSLIFEPEHVAALLRLMTVWAIAFAGRDVVALAQSAEVEAAADALAAHIARSER